MDKYITEQKHMGHYSTFKDDEKQVNDYHWYYHHMYNYLLTGDYRYRKEARRYYRRFMNRVIVK